MKRLVQRAFAIVLAAVVAAGTVLPIVWCVGGPDHSVIEFGLGGGWHVVSDADPVARVTYAQASISTSRPHMDGCEDRKVLAPAISAEESCRDLTAVLKRFSVLCTGLRCETTVMPRHIGRALVPDSVLFVSPQLRQLRTVILLT